MSEEIKVRGRFQLGGPITIVVDKDGPGFPEMELTTAQAEAVAQFVNDMQNLARRLEMQGGAR